MKTTIKLSILAVMAAFMFSSCSKQSIEGLGSTKSKSYANSNFSEIDHGLSTKAKLIPDTLSTVKIIAKKAVTKAVKNDAMHAEKDITYNPPKIVVPVELEMDPQMQADQIRKDMAEANKLEQTMAVAEI